MDTSRSYLDEKTLLSALAKGDEAAFTELYNLYWETLYITAFHVLADQSLARDVVQDVFAWLWENRVEVTINTTMEGYLRAAAKFKSANIIRRDKLKDSIFKKIKNMTPASGEDITPNLEAKELQRVIDEAVRSLPPKCKEIYELSRRGHLSAKEIAARLGLSEKTVENQLTIALKRLRQSAGYALLVVILSQL
jgi:RNA polymerase sigma-70 factor (family 1)